LVQARQNASAGCAANLYKEKYCQSELKKIDEAFTALPIGYQQSIVNRAV
jgi:hypothetical protein